MMESKTGILHYLIKSKVSFSERLLLNNFLGLLLFYLIPCAAFKYFAAQGGLVKEEVKTKMECSF